MQSTDFSTSQLPVIMWYELFQAQTIADAVLDRIVHTAHRLELKGESIRKNKVKNHNLTDQKWLPLTILGGSFIEISTGTLSRY